MTDRQAMAHHYKPVASSDKKTTRAYRRDDALFTAYLSKAMKPRRIQCDTQPRGWARDRVKCTQHILVYKFNTTKLNNTNNNHQQNRPVGRYCRKKVIAALTFPHRRCAIMVNTKKKVKNKQTCSERKKKYTQPQARNTTTK